MIRYHSQEQLSLAEFDWPFQTALDENNRWVKLSGCIPCDELAEGYRDPRHGALTQSGDSLHYCPGHVHESEICAQQTV
jgi:hypothetical protein